jgi:outer membrane biosynthesis protein TonB
VKRALVGSLVLHVALVAALVSREVRTSDGVPSKQTIAIEIVAPPTIAPPMQTPPTDVQGGGSIISHASTAATKRTPSPPAHARRSQPVRMKVADLVDYSLDRSGHEHANGGGVDRDGDGGEGNGTGGNRGDGIGFGDGSRIRMTEDQLTLPPPPAERPVSKARPAKLIYPSRERDMGEERLFVARVTVDTDGYVVGAKLVRGSNGPRDDEAADLIFRFRYLPALDDAGHAVKTTFEQPFHVNR